MGAPHPWVRTRRNEGRVSDVWPHRDQKPTHLSKTAVKW